MLSDASASTMMQVTLSLAERRCTCKQSSGNVANEQSEFQPANERPPKTLAKKLCLFAGPSCPVTCVSRMERESKVEVTMLQAFYLAGNGGTKRPWNRARAVMATSLRNSLLRIRCTAQRLLLLWSRHPDLPLCHLFPGAAETTQGRRDACIGPSAEMPQRPGRIPA